jgi:type II secretory pathway pseudopilin PulG
MLTLLLVMAMMAIAATIIVSDLKFTIRRDREEEMIHRGVQYSRAIRAYYKKFGRYPTKIEDLESTNNQRFLRKRYKDPLNCKNSKCEDFRLLHFGEVQMGLSGIGGSVIPGASPIGASSFGGSSTGSGFGGSSTGSGLGGSSSFGGSSSSSFGQSQPTAGNGTTGSNPSQPSPDGTDASADGSNQLGSGQIFGGPIIGVASATKIKDSTIREFNHKKKYKEWYFVYDPAQDQGRLITTPYQPQLQQGFGQQGTPNLNGQNGSSGQPGSNGSFGNSGFGNNNSGFGSSSSGFGNSPSSPSSGGLGTPNPPSNSPQQQ